MESIWPSKGHNSFDFLQLLPYPPSRTSRHFVIVDCLSPPNLSTPIITHNNNKDTNETNGTISTSKKPSFTSVHHNSCREKEIDFTSARTMFL